MARPVVTGIGRRLPMPRSFATFKPCAYEVRNNDNVPDRIVIQYVPDGQQ